MNREIKFRVWNKYGMNVPCTLKEMSEFIAKPGERVTSETWEEGTIFMQFTGLTDKNNKEIYEGDIITSIYAPGNFLIRFGEYHEYDADDDECTTIGFYTIDSEFDCHGFGKAITGDTECYEVIGNIYENPELIK